MKGYHVERRFGWDTHGLPIEHEIDKKLGISGKEAVMKIGIAKYNEECRAIVMRYASEWRTTIERLGRWIDFDNDYKVSIICCAVVSFLSDGVADNTLDHGPKIHGV
jgi:isoleucyl-tRNA synthetase